MWNVRERKAERGLLKNMGCRVTTREMGVDISESQQNLKGWSRRGRVMHGSSFTIFRGFVLGEAGQGGAGWVVSCDCEGMVRLAIRRGLYIVKKAHEREREREKVNDCLAEIHYSTLFRHLPIT